MASELVERLAKKWVEKTYNPIPDEVDRKTARWWGNAFADYFETQEAIDAWPYPSLHPANVADFLRDQMGAPSDD